MPMGLLCFLCTPCVQAPAVKQPRCFHSSASKNRRKRARCSGSEGKEAPETRGEGRMSHELFSVAVGVRAELRPAPAVTPASGSGQEP